MIATASQSFAASHKSLIELQTGGSRRPLICVHPVDGTLNVYRRLLGQLPTDLPVYGLEADREIDPEESLSELAVRYADELLASNLEQPYRLIGFSFGAIVAMHVAAEVEARGGTVEFVGIVDYRPFGMSDRQAMRDCLANYLAAVHQQYSRRSSVLRRVPDAELTRVTSEVSTYLFESEQLPSTEDGVIAFQNAGLIEPAVQVETVADFFRPLFGRLNWLRTSDLRPIDAPLVVWRAAEGFGSGCGEWSAWTTAVREEAPLPGNHLTAMQSQSARQLSAELSGWLDALDVTAHLEAVAA